MGIDTEKYRPLLEILIEKHSNQPIDVIITDISTWCRDRGKEVDPFRAAMAIRDGQSRKAGILIAKRITSEMIATVKTCIELNGFKAEVEALKTEQDFLTHTILHEIAHLLNNWTQQEESLCDRWAFTKMGITA